MRCQTKDVHRTLVIYQWPRHKLMLLMLLPIVSFHATASFQPFTTKDFLILMFLTVTNPNMQSYLYYNSLKLVKNLKPCNCFQNGNILLPYSDKCGTQPNNHYIRENILDQCYYSIKGY